MILVYIYMFMDFHDSLMASVPMNHRSLEVFYTVSSVLIELTDVSLCWSLNFRASICYVLTFDPAKNAIQGDAPEGSDTF